MNGGGGLRPFSSRLKKLTIFDLGLRFAGKTVLIRCDFNGTVKNGEIVSTTRLDAALGSIKYALEQGAEQIVLLSHNGRNKQIAKEGTLTYSLEPAVQYLTEKLGVGVDFANGFDKPITSFAKVVLMENTREDARDEVKDPAKNEAYAREILNATDPDIYVLDGFSVSHRDQASVTWLGKLMKEQGKLAVAGSLLQREYEFLVEKVIKHPAQPFLVFLGGSKVSGEGGKIQMIRPLLSTVDRIVIGGAMAQPFMLEKGYKVENMDPFARKDGRAEELAEERAQAREILDGPYGHKVIIPTSVISQDREIIDVSTTPAPEGFVMRDIVISNVVSELSAIRPQTILFNGTFGAYEPELGKHVAGTYEVLLFMGDQTTKGATTILGGGDTLRVEKSFAQSEFGQGKMYTHKSTGGGASGKLLTLGFAGQPEELPGFAALTDR
jgi:3-phosphoglycerate kinase